MQRRLLLLAAFNWCALVAGVAAAAEPPDYATQVEPIFRKYCVGCHNAQDHEGDLVLESYQSLLAGGKRGAVVAAGKQLDSRLLQVLSGKAEPAMPPEDNECPSAEEIALLAAWVDGGAKGPSGEEPDRTRLVVPKIKPTGARPDPIASLAFSPGGDLLALARYGAVEIVSPGDGLVRRRLDGLRGRVNAVSFSTDGTRLVAAGGEPGLVGEAVVWNVADGSVVRAIVGHADSLYAAALSPDGSLLATAGYDQQIKLWDLAGGRELRSLTGHNDCVYDLAFRVGGRVLASASGDRTAKLWDVASGERLETFGQPLKELYAVAFSPDGALLAAGGVDNRIRIWRVSPDAKENTNPLLISRFAHEGPIVRLAFSPDGARLLSTAEDRTVKLWSVAAMSELLALERQSEIAAGAAFSPDGARVAIGRLDGTWAVYDSRSGARVGASAALRRPLPWQQGRIERSPRPHPNPLPEGEGIIVSAGRVLPAVALWALSADAPPVPQLFAIAPRGIERGRVGRFKLRGEKLADVREVKSSHPQLTAAIVGQSTATEVEIEATAAAEVPRGRHELWLAGPGGASARVGLVVDDLPQSQEVEPNDAAAAATPLALPTSCWGQLSAKGDVDCFAFDAAAGQTIVCEVATRLAGSRADVMLTLSDAAGHTLATANDFDGQPDPLLAHTFVAAGRYLLRVNDLRLDGGEDFYYRLTVGQLPFATAVFPPSVAAGVEARLRLVGFNLPRDAAVAVPASAPGEIDVPLPAGIRTRGPLKVVAGSLGESVEIEPNDEPAQATPLAAPGVGSGVIDRPGDADLFRFESPAGATWIVETEAARRGSPVDTVVEVLWPDGRPVERLLLAAMRDAALTFRGVDSNNNGDIRLTNWEEMELDDYVYIGGEVGKIFRQPRGPDSGFNFYEGDGGRRRTEFDTTATVHALDDPAYIVVPHPPGTTIPATGLPTFPLYYMNDDDGQRRLGADSRLSFTAPAAGSYLVRVRDSRGAGGERFIYRLRVRPAAPDFAVRLSTENPTVAAGSGQSFFVTAERIDGFDGEIRVDFGGVLPPGFSVTTPVVIEASQRDARAVLLAAADAPAPTEANWSHTQVTATATIGGQSASRPVKGLGRIALAPKPKLLVRLAPDESAGAAPGEIRIRPGARAAAWLRVERGGFDGIVNLEVANLPYGVIVDDIGLNNVQILEGQTERQIFFRCAPWVRPTARPIHPIANVEGNQAGPAVTLVVE